MQIKEFLEKETKRYKELFKSAQLAYWNAILSGKSEDYKKYEEISLKWIEHFSNKENFELIKEFMKQSENEIDSRQLKLLYLKHLGFQGEKDLLKKITEKETKLEQTFNTFRSKIGDEEFTDNQIKEILKKETSSEKLQRAWEASKKQGEVVEKDLLELVKLRNKLAKSLGFENYYLMSLELNEIDANNLKDILLKIKSSTNQKFKELKLEIDENLSKKQKISRDQLKPWHYQDLFFQEAPEIYDLDLDKYYKKDVLKTAEEFYTKIGLETKDILERSDLYERPGKYQHACCMDMDKEGDTRIVQNVKNNEYWVSTTLHELGHAVYEKYFDLNLPFILRGPTHTFVTEAIAILFEKNSKNPKFIQQFTENKEIKEDLRKQLILEKIVVSRWFQVMVNFERELYKNPNQDLNKLWWEMVEEFQGIKFYRDKPDWASKIHFTNAPVYYHNYMLGTLLASQIHEHLVNEILENQDIKNYDYNKKEVGEFLKEKIFLPGQRFKWNELIERTFKEKLNPEYFVQEFIY